ncbi:MAG TPA: hypothetical protein VHK00_09380 [Miltoncostaeaceae bacterium]|jgi:hypothetical protein|nr:hypothetical protein [Miltoncostaeaceae bacterium]
MGLSEPALSLTDLALGLVVIALAVRLQGTPGVHRYWRLTFWWAGAAALAGAVHHGVVTYSDTWSGPSWAVISMMVVVAVSYLLAASVVEVLGPGRGRVFWVLRSAGLVAYAGLAIAGYAGVNSILACEGVTMLAILWLWGRALREGHPLALPVIVAILASGAAAGVRALPDDVTGLVGLDPTSLYHLAQIPGMVLFFLALAAAPQWLRRPARAGPVATAR